MDALFAEWLEAEADVSRRHRKLMAAVGRKQELERRMAAAAAGQGQTRFEARGRSFVVTEAVEAAALSQSLLKGVFAEAFKGDPAQARRLLDRVLAARPTRRRPRVMALGSPKGP